MKLQYGKIYLQNSAFVPTISLLIKYGPSFALPGTLQRAIGEPQSAFEKGTGEEGGIILEEYYVQKKIRMVDTRGFFARDEKLYDECYNIMTGR